MTDNGFTPRHNKQAQDICTTCSVPNSGSHHCATRCQAMAKNVLGVRASSKRFVSCRWMPCVLCWCAVKPINHSRASMLIPPPCATFSSNATFGVVSQHTGPNSPRAHPCIDPLQRSRTEPVDMLSPAWQCAQGCARHDRDACCRDAADERPPIHCHLDMHASRKSVCVDSTSYASPLPMHALLHMILCHLQPA